MTRGAGGSGPGHHRPCRGVPHARDRAPLLVPCHPPVSRGRPGMSRSPPPIFRTPDGCRMLSSVAMSWAEVSPRPPGVPVEVVAAAGCFVLSAGLAAATGTLPGSPSPVMLLLGWPLFALAGGVVLDLRPDERTGRVLAVFALVPALDLACAVVRSGPS